MLRRQTIPTRWLIIAARSNESAGATARRLPRGTGVLLLTPPERREMLRLRLVARRRALLVVEEAAQTAARVHNVRELRSALLRRTPLILLSPLHSTPTHPGWRPVRRMRAAALARMGRRRLIALGGMNADRFAAIKPLGFAGWAGIRAWSKSPAE